VSNRKCLTCGNEYTYCPRCGKFATLPKWYINWDSEECHDVFDAIKNYNFGNIKKEGIKKVLDQYEVKDYSKYTKEISDELNGIFKEEGAKVYMPKHEQKKENFGFHKKQEEE